MKLRSAVVSLPRSISRATTAPHRAANDNNPPECVRCQPRRSRRPRGRLVNFIWGFLVGLLAVVFVMGALPWPT